MIILSQTYLRGDRRGSELRGQNTRHMCSARKEWNVNQISSTTAELPLIGKEKINYRVLEGSEEGKRPLFTPRDVTGAAMFAHQPPVGLHPPSWTIPLLLASRKV